VTGLHRVGLAVALAAACGTESPSASGATAALDPQDYDRWRQPDRVVAAIGLASGHVVVDVGADLEPWSAIVDSVAVPDEDDLVDCVYAEAPTLRTSDTLPQQKLGGASRIPDAVDTDAPGDWRANDFNASSLPCCWPGVPTSGKADNTSGKPNRFHP
jgi:hypothetical protein